MTDSLNSRVFIVNDSYKHDYTDSRPFGRPVRVTVGNAPIFDARIVWDIREVMEDFTVNDYVLLSGHALLCFYVMSEALRRVSEAKILVWGAKESTYKVLTITRKFWEFMQPEEEQWEMGGGPEKHS